MVTLLVFSRQNFHGQISNANSTHVESGRSSVPFVSRLIVLKGHRRLSTYANFSERKKEKKEKEKNRNLKTSGCIIQVWSANFENRALNHQQLNAIDQFGGSWTPDKYTISQRLNVVLSLAILRNSVEEINICVRGILTIYLHWTKLWVKQLHNFWPIHLFHNGGQIKYSFVLMLISLTRLATMYKIQRKFCS